MQQYRDDRRRKIIRRFAKVGQFQKLDRRLRSLGASVFRKLGGVDRVCSLWAAETKAALNAKRQDRFVLNSLNTLLRLLEFTLADEAKERVDSNKGQDWSRLTDADINQRLQDGMVNLVKAKPELAILAAESLGWTVIPPAGSRAG